MDINKITSIVQGLAATENGGKLDLNKLQAGKSGETKSIFQFMPDTWKEYSKETSGKNNLPLNPHNEVQVVTHKVNEWYDKDIQEGYTPKEATMRIASRWNAGEQNPDAYKQNYKGTNKEGVAYNTPAYAKKVADYATKFEENSGVSTSNTEKPQNPSSGGLLALGGSQSQPQQSQGLLPPLMKQARQV